MADKPVVHGQFGHSKVPAHYFVTPRQSGLPIGYFRKLTWRNYIDTRDIAWVVAAILLIVGCSVVK